MTRIFVSLFLILFVFGCGVVKKKTSYSKDRKVTVDAREENSKSTGVPEEEKRERSGKDFPDKAENIITTALTYSGVRYKFGGTTRKGMDCSGLLYVAFGTHNVPLPRVSYQMANEGRHIKVTQVTKGDLLFFKTSKRGKRINHVGLVVAVEGDEIKFINSTSSRGVIVSSLREGFWNYAFVKATRIL
jgi:cell wall-associated NlpC family hydrolase